MGYQTLRRLEADPNGCVLQSRSTLSADPKKPLRIQGYATKFNEIGGPYRGRAIMIHPSAFDKVDLRDRAIKCLLGHNDDFVLGSTAGRNLAFQIRPNGLWMTCDLVDSPIGRHVYESIKRKDMTNQSIGFLYSASDSKEIKDDDGNLIEVVGRATELIETSIVAWGVYGTTTAEAVDIPDPPRPSIPARVPVPTAPAGALPSIAAKRNPDVPLDYYRRRLEEEGRADLERRKRFLEETEKALWESRKAEIENTLYGMN